MTLKAKTRKINHLYFPKGKHEEIDSSIKNLSRYTRLISEKAKVVELLPMII